MSLHDTHIWQRGHSHIVDPARSGSPLILVMPMLIACCEIERIRMGGHERVIIEKADVMARAEAKRRRLEEARACWY